MDYKGKSYIRYNIEDLMFTIYTILKYILIILLVLSVYGTYLEYTEQNNIENSYRDIVDFSKFEQTEYLYMENELETKPVEFLEEAFEKTGVVGDAFLKDDGIIIYQTQIEEPTDGYITNGRYIKSGNNKHTIQLARRLECFLDDTLFHELGHYLDHKIGDVSQTEEFLSYYEKYKESPLSIDDNFAYTSSTAKEFFAERYSDYILYADALREESPEIYNFIAKSIEQLEKEQLL